MTRRRAGLVVALAMIAAVLLAARRYRPEDAPFTPRDDGEVLERVAPGAGADPSGEALRALEAALARAPGDVTLACRVARAHIDAARLTGDARRLAYAEAALMPFWQRPDPPPPVLLLRATIRQARHELDPALADLDRLLTIAPRDAQAWLTRASVLIVQARYDEARASCARLRGLATPLVEAGCAAQLEGVTGGDGTARARLLLLAAAPNVALADRAWARSVAGEAAMYAGDPTAEPTLRLALRDDPHDVYARGLLGDLLLDAERPQEVLALIAADEPNEALLLRRAIAARRVGAPDAAALAARLRARDAELRARGDGSHRREEARRLLALDGDPAGALQAARAGFAAQREPWDARVLLESAAAARSDEARAAAGPAFQWLRRSGCAWPPLRRAAAALSPDDHLPAGPL